MAGWPGEKAMSMYSAHYSKISRQVVFAFSYSTLCIWYPLSSTKGLNYVQTMFFSSPRGIVSAWALYTEWKYGGPLGRRPRRVAWKRGWSVFHVLFCRCFPRKVFLRRRFDLSFSLPTSFCVAECHQKEVKSSTAEKGFFSFFFSFPVRLRWGENRPR